MAEQLCTGRHLRDRLDVALLDEEEEAEAVQKEKALRQDRSR